MLRIIPGLLAVVLLALGAASPALADNYDITLLSHPEGGQPIARGINDSGLVVGDYYKNSQDFGFIYNSAAQTYNTFQYSNYRTAATGINDSGQVVGTYNSPYAHGFLKTGDTYNQIFYPGSIYTSAEGVNDSGQVVGYYYLGGGHGFVYTPGAGGGYTSLNVPGATSTSAYGINNAGQVVGYYKMGTVGHGFLYTPGPGGGAYTTLDFPGSAFTRVFDINDVGQIVGEYSYADGYSHGFIYDGVTFTPFDVDLLGTGHTTITGINNSGVMVGGYSHGQAYGFLATPSAPVPAPGSLLLLSSGLLGLALAGRKLRKS
ncbi:MAG: hypothetical protein FJ134_08915 [Deltaproteobacteria bacterium]|nr:hypothetical protein [Deltaproteobacteria bacterium]